MPIDNQFLQVLTQAIQIGQQAVNQRQQLDLDRQRFQEQVKQNDAVFSLRQEGLQLQQENLQLRIEREKNLQSQRELMGRVKEGQLEIAQAKLQPEIDKMLAQIDLIKAKGQSATASDVAKNLHNRLEVYRGADASTHYLNESLRQLPATVLQANLKSLATIKEDPLQKALRTPEENDDLNTQIETYQDALRNHAISFRSFMQSLTDVERQGLNQTEIPAVPTTATRTNIIGPATNTGLSLGATTDKQRELQLKLDKSDTDPEALSQEILDFLHSTAPREQRETFGRKIQQERPDLWTRITAKSTKKKVTK